MEFEPLGLAKDPLQKSHKPEIHKSVKRKLDHSEQVLVHLPK